MSSAKFSVDTGLVIATINLASIFFVDRGYFRVAGPLCLRGVILPQLALLSRVWRILLLAFFSFTQPCVRLFSRGGAGFYNPTRLLSRGLCRFFIPRSCFLGAGEFVEHFLFCQRGWILQLARFFVKWIRQTRHKELIELINQLFYHS